MVHILNSFNNTYGGSELHALSLFDELAEHTDVAVWTEGTPPVEYYGTYPIRQITSSDYPKGGNIVFLGAYFTVGSWFRRANPERVIVVYNMVEPARLFPLLEAFKRVEGLPKTEVVFVSNYLRGLTPGVEGVVEHSPIDLNRFTPPTWHLAPDLGPKARGFTVGKHTRDDPRKHHPEDPALYESLAEKGVHIKLMGGTCLSLTTRPEIQVLPTATEDAADFLKTLDVFYFRNDPSLPEAGGRSVVEAMATALPVVASREGGYADHILHGENGFLVDSAEEAEQIILMLRDDNDLRLTIGRAARQTIEVLYSPEAKEERVNFYSRRP